MTVNNIRHTSAVDKFPDGAIYFRKADNNSLDVDLKIND
jgi:hypothetical protein